MQTLCHHNAPCCLQSSTQHRGVNTAATLSQGTQAAAAQSMHIHHTSCCRPPLLLASQWKALSSLCQDTVVQEGSISLSSNISKKCLMLQVVVVWGSSVTS